MHIQVKRLWPKAKYIIGRMTVDGQYYCDTLEPPKVRGNSLKDRKKMYGFGCCIPPGIYHIQMYPSAHFKRMLPILVNVPNRTGILIHQGNHVSDTLGCILVGWNRKVGYLTKSRAALNPLIEKIETAVENEEEITIEITELKFRKLT